MRGYRYVLQALIASAVTVALAIVLKGGQTNNSQSTLQPGVPIERALAPNQSHNFNVSLKQDQFLQLVVDQRGIDVGVRVYSPSGRRIGDFDSPNGTAGPENVTAIADTNGNYRIEVLPLDQFRNPLPGRYEIRIVDIRKATDQELKSSKNANALKAKGMALLTDATEDLDRVRRPQTRAEYQLQIAKLLWSTDEKRAMRLTEQAIDSVKEYLSGPVETADIYQSYSSALQLRRSVIEGLAPHDPEKAIAFLTSTRALMNPDFVFAGNTQSQELQLQLSLANQIATNNPRRAFQVAEDSLKEGDSQSIVSTMQQLRSKDTELASRLAHDIAAKLMKERLLGSTDTAFLASSFLQSMGSGRATGANSTAIANASLITDEEFKALLQKGISESLSYTMTSPTMYTPQRSAEQNLTNALHQMVPTLQTYAPDRAAAVEGKWAEFNGADNAIRQAATTSISTGSIDAGLEVAGRAPLELQDQLYQQVANKAASAGDLPRARQIITDHISDPQQRQQMLMNVERQGIYSAASSGKFDDAMTALANFRPANERPSLLAQIVNQLNYGPALKKSTTALFLEQARNMLGASPRAEDRQQMNVLLTIGGTFARLESIRSFEIVEPLVEQFNEISTAAQGMNGFPEKFYDDGELITDNGNSIGDIANQLTTAVGSLSLFNFDRAKAVAERIRPANVRLRAYLAMAQQAIQPTR